MNEFHIGRRMIGADHSPFVVAEVGINHEGDFNKAIQMVDAAVSAGADCVKFQCHITEAEMIPTNMKPGDISDERLWDIIKRCELSEDEERRLKAYCREKGIIYLCTPFSREAADRLNDMGVEAFKIGSGECNNLPLLDHIGRFKKPIILSTGMNNIASIQKSVTTIQKHGVPLMLMHCTSMYPTPYDKVRLGAIRELIDTFNLPVGLSDHSIGIYTCLGAVALGACVLEKHFTISRSWPGPDTSLSIEPDELRDLIQGAQAVFSARGGKKETLPEEKPVIDFAYASVVTINPIKKGEAFSLKNIWVKRPGTGPIQARDFDKILGKKANRDLNRDIQLKPDDIQF
jgi:N-acetylneuraminate synthase